MISFIQLVTATIVCCYLILVGVWCWVRWTHRHLIRAASNLHPLFPTLPILGNLHYARFSNEKITALVIEAAHRLSSIGIYTASVWIGPYPIICVFGVDDIQKVNSSLKVPAKGFEVESIKFVLGTGLFSAPTDIWKITRHALEPLFHPRNIKQLIPTFNRNSKELVTRISQYEGQGTFDVSHSVHVASLQFVCNFIFGSELNFDTNSEEFLNLLDLTLKGPQIAVHKIFRFWLQSDLIFNYLYKKEIEKMNWQWKMFSTAPLKMSIKNIEKKKFLRGSSTVNNYDNQSDATNEGPLNLISVYNELQQKFPHLTEEDLKYEVMTMYMAGTDTVNNIVSHCLLLLAYHQDIQENLYEEIISAIHADSDITSDDLQKMPYLDQVFKETLRWSMLVPFVSRRADKDMKLSSCTIPKGCGFLIGNSGPFMDPKIYPDPTKFNPDHFLPERSQGRHKSAFLPFNAGPRDCIGKQYADIFSRIMIVHVLRKFKLSTSMDVYQLKRKMTFFMFSSEGYNIKLHKRYD